MIAEVRRPRGSTRQRVTETTGTGTETEVRITTTTTATVPRTRTPALRSAGSTLPPARGATEAESTGPEVRRER